MARKGRKKKKDDTPRVSEDLSGDIDDLATTLVMDAQPELPPDDDTTTELPQPKELIAASAGRS
jgi:hypothetical protein